MNLVFRIFTLIFLLCVNTLLFAAETVLVTKSYPNNDDPTIFLGPTIQGSYTRLLTDNTALSVLGEAGLKNLRLGATSGFRIDNKQIFKVSAEWLRQEGEYDFFSSDADEWLNQWALGAGYQYEFAGYQYHPAFNLSAYYSHAPSKTVGTETGILAQTVNSTTIFVDQKRIAGSNAAGIAPAISFSPWMGGTAGLELNYDHVRYDNEYTSDETAIGFGGTGRLDQALTDRMVLGLSAAVRQPFNNYGARIGWNDVPFFGGAGTFGIGGAYTVGKETLHNTWNIGISFDYMLDSRATINLKNHIQGNIGHSAIRDPFLTWTAKPAVYMPEVLAIKDEVVTITTTTQKPKPPTPPCTAPGLTGINIMGQFASPGAALDPIETALAFTGSNLTYTLIGPAFGTVTINPTTGVISGNAPESPEQNNYQVQASNACGSVRSGFFILSNFPDLHK